MANIRIEDRNKIIKIPLTYSELLIELEKEQKVKAENPFPRLSNLLSSGKPILYYCDHHIEKMHKFKIIGKNRRHLIIRVLFILCFL